jgi:hypothetical protein
LQKALQAGHDRAGNELDGKLGLTKQSAARTVAELAAAGQGQGGMPGESGQGKGERGSLGRMGLHGRDGTGQDGQRNDGSGGRGRRHEATNGSASGMSEAVDVVVESAATPAGGELRQRGVPMRYQPAVRDYFRRLARDDQNGDGHEQ